MLRETKTPGWGQFFSSYLRARGWQMRVEVGDEGRGGRGGRGSKIMRWWEENGPWVVNT